MKDVLVIQLARLGDLLQTKRLVLSLVGLGLRVHLLLDASLGPLAQKVYPQAVVHTIKAHSQPDPAALLASLHELARVPFVQVFNLNYSGLNLAVSTLFDPALVRGHRLEAGQPHKDPWAAMAFRWSGRRRLGGMNLVDFWAGYARPLAAPDSVNPAASPGGAGLGVVLAGRQARRSLPPEVLAPLVGAAMAGVSGGRIRLLGSSAERGPARALAALLPPRLGQLVDDLTGKTSLVDLLDAVQGLDRLLTPDTGVMHLAAHLGVPVTAFFLSSAWCHETGPYGRGHTVWQATAPCAPCLETAPCPEGLACLAPFAWRGLMRLIGQGGAARADRVAVQGGAARADRVAVQGGASLPTGALGQSGASLPAAATGHGGASYPACAGGQGGAATSARAFGQGKVAEPGDGLVGYRTDFDELGVVCAPFAGQDRTQAERTRLRAFLARHQGLLQGQAEPASPDLAEWLVADPEFMLPRSGPYVFG